MKVIIAQGNPGNTYTYTRHNVGWLVLDQFARDHDATFTQKTKFKAFIAEISVSGEKVLLVKPSTFYNETGQSARTLVDFYQLATSDVLVLHDDIALPFGTLRIRRSGSPAGNNGIKSLNAHLGDNYWRMRIGIYNPLRDKLHDADFVLSKFSSGEQENLTKEVIPVAIKSIEMFLGGNLQPTSHSVLQ